MTSYLVVPFVMVLISTFVLALASRRKSPAAASKGGKPLRDILEAARVVGGVGELDSSGNGVVTLPGGDRRFSLTTSELRKGSPTYYWVGAEIGPSPSAFGDVLDAVPTLAVRHESSLDRLAKRLGLAKELDVGDADFDRSVYVETDDHDVARRLLASAEARAMVRWLVVEAHADVVFNTAGQALAARFHAQSVPATPQALAGVIDALGGLARALPAFREVHVALRASNRKLQPLTLLASLGFVLALLALAMFLTRFEPIGAGFHVAAVAASFVTVAIGLAVAWRASRGRAASLARFVLAAGCILLAAPGVTAGTMLWVNAAGVTATTEITTKLVHRRIERSRRRHETHYIQVADWQGGRPVWIEVSRAQYVRATGGGDLVLVVGEGRLGFPFFRDVRTTAP